MSHSMTYLAELKIKFSRSFYYSYGYLDYTYSVMSSSDSINMPRYAILEVVLEEYINFVQREKMIESIIKPSKDLAIDMQKYLETFDEIS